MIWCIVYCKDLRMRGGPHPYSSYTPSIEILNIFFYLVAFRLKTKSQRMFFSGIIRKWVIGPHGLAHPQTPGIKIALHLVRANEPGELTKTHATHVVLGTGVIQVGFN